MDSYIALAWQGLDQHDANRLPERFEVKSWANKTIAKFVQDFIANRIFYNSSQEDFIFQINTHQLGENYNDWIKNLAATGTSLVIDSTYYAFVEQFRNQYAGIQQFLLRASDTQYAP